MQRIMNLEAIREIIGNKDIVRIFGYSDRIFSKSLDRLNDQFRNEIIDLLLFAYLIFFNYYFLEINNELIVIYSSSFSLQ